MTAMRNIFVPALDEQVSAIGFGCASLGSRISREEGLRSVCHAYENGVTWYDVAPSYGDGEAELNLAPFISGRREHIQICTKVGILPARTPWLMRKMKPLARSAIGAVPTLRRALTKNRPLARKTPLTVALIHDSLHGSLKRLGVDYVDVLALHAAEEEEVVREDIIRALEDVVSSGKARTISVASTLDSGLKAIDRSDVYGIVQVPNNPFEPNLQKATAQHSINSPITFVTHSAYGCAGALDRLLGFLLRTPKAMAAVRELGYVGSPHEVSAAMLIDFALSDNRKGVTLVSMFKQKHLQFNIEHLLNPNKNIEKVFRFDGANFSIAGICMPGEDDV